MGLCPFVAAVAAVAALALPPLAPPNTSTSQSPAGTEPPARGPVTGPAPRVPTTVPSPLGSTPTTRTPPPPVPGPTTTTVPKFSSFLAQSVDFVTADDGFVLGYVRCGKEVCFALRRTLDRGASWLALPPPPFSVGAPDDRALLELHFANTLDGWAFGTTLWWTDDGARSWHQVDLGGPVLAVASGAGEAYAVVQPCRPLAVVCDGPGKLYRSLVGTDRWAQVPGAPVGLDVETGPFSLVAEGRTVFLAAPYLPELFVSTDGLHFSSLPVPCSQSPTGLGPFRPGQLVASNPTDLVLTCFGQPGMGTLPTEVFISHDGGRSFSRLPTPSLLGQGAQVALAGPTTLLLGTSGPPGTWLERAVSPDRSWSTPLERHDDGAGLTDLAFVDPLHGAFVYCPAPFALDYFGPYGTPGGQVYLTDDGGSSWSAVHIPS
ncbi:MAG TPA: hypothetical protein VMF65_02950 [Acidimicrobiales bacterium]|nr:hypothetical protein [Acidimicrobiales bacterium]